MECLISTAYNWWWRAITPLRQRENARAEQKKHREQRLKEIDATKKRTKKTQKDLSGKLNQKFLQTMWYPLRLALCQFDEIQNSVSGPLFLSQCQYKAGQYHTNSPKSSIDLVHSICSLPMMGNDDWLGLKSVKNWFAKLLSYWMKLSL